MEKVYIMDNRGRETVAYKVRHLNFNGNNYFVYTLNEIDADGYVKLYLKRIVDNGEVEISSNEWETIKASIPVIVKEIKNNDIKSFRDLSMRGINEIMDGYAKVFKLKKDIVELITYEEVVIDEIPKFEVNDDEVVVKPIQEVVERENTPVVPTIPQNQVDVRITKLNEEIGKYKELCINLKRQNEALREELNKSNNKLARLKEIMKDI